MFNSSEKKIILFVLPDIFSPHALEPSSLGDSKDLSFLDILIYLNNTRLSSRLLPDV